MLCVLFVLLNVVHCQIVWEVDTIYYPQHAEQVNDGGTSWMEVDNLVDDDGNSFSAPSSVIGSSGARTLR